jgi:hypothetical protein
MSDGILYNSDGDYITEWFWWTPFLLMFGTPVVGGLIEGGLPLGLLIATPMIMMIIIQKFWPI